MRMKLTKRNIDALVPGDKRYTAWDTDVLRHGLRVSPSGEKAHGVKYRAGGRQRRFTIGRQGAWTPEAAHKEALRLLGEVARGLDPAESVAPIARRSRSPISATSISPKGPRIETEHAARRSRAH